MPLSNRTHKGLLDSLFSKSSVFGALGTVPTIRVALSTTAPNMSGGNVTEPSGSGYARVASSGSTWTTATSADPSVLENTAAIEFPSASGSWGTLTHFVLYDAATAGNVLGYGTLTTPKAVGDGDTPRFAIGELKVELRSPA
jgi:hypothetical protein